MFFIIPNLNWIGNLTSFIFLGVKKNQAGEGGGSIKFEIHVIFLHFMYKRIYEITPSPNSNNQR